MRFSFDDGGAIFASGYGYHGGIWRMCSVALSADQGPYVGLDVDSCKARRTNAFCAHSLKKGFLRVMRNFNIYIISTHTGCRKNNEGGISHYLV